MYSNNYPARKQQGIMLVIAFLLILNGINFISVNSFQFSVFNKPSFCGSTTSLSSRECENVDAVFNRPDNIGGTSKSSIMQIISSFATFSSVSSIALIGKAANAQEPTTTKAKKPKVLEVQNLYMYVCIYMYVCTQL